MAVRALRFDQRGRTLYIGSAPAGKLLEFTTIDRFRPDLPIDDPGQGYQRLPEQGRLSRLAMNLIRKEGGGILPTAVLLASRKPAQFVVESNGYGTLVADDDEPYQIVDGQTRLLGIKHGIDNRGEAELRDFEVPFVLLDNVDP